MEVLVIGANGQVGWELVRRGAPMGLQMVGVDIPDIDITLADSVKKWNNAAACSHPAGN